MSPALTGFIVNSPRPAPGILELATLNAKLVLTLVGMIVSEVDAMIPGDRHRHNYCESSCKYETLLYWSLFLATAVTYTRREKSQWRL